MLAPDTAKAALGRSRNGLQEASLLGSKNGSGYPTKSAFNQAQSRARLRRQRLVEHRLGPSPLGHSIREVEDATGADVTARLERYAKIDPEFVRALGGDQFAPLVHVIDEGGHG